MPNYNVIIQPEAELDLDKAYQFLEDQKHGLGFDLLTEITDIFEILESNPYLFQTVYGEKRRAITKRFYYNVIFVIEEQVVYILAILHGKRDIKGLP